MKVGEIWARKKDRNESPLIPIKNGEMLRLNESDKADNFFYMPSLIKLVKIFGDYIEAIACSNDEMQLGEIEIHGIVYSFTRSELISCYAKDWEKSGEQHATII